MIVNISNPKVSKTYSVKVETIPYMGKQLGDEVDLNEIGVKGKGKITGGSTKEGFPMVSFIDEPKNKKVLLSDGIAFKSRFKGEKKRRTVHGRIVSERISQINIKILNLDKSENLDERFPKTEEKK